MISVIEVYNVVKDIANKDQKGFVTPKVFNSLAGVAQDAVFSEILSELSGAANIKLRNLDSSGGESIYRGVLDDLSEYKKELLIETKGGSNVYGSSCLFLKPVDFYKLISIQLNDDARTQAELVYSSEKISHILSSRLSAPTESYPVALVSRDIEVFPTDITQIVMNYYRQPQSVYITNTGDFFAGDIDETSKPRISTLSNNIDDEGLFAIDPFNSRNFDLPKKYINELVGEICKLIGVRLRDQVLSGFGANETQDK